MTIEAAIDTECRIKNMNKCRVSEFVFLHN